MTNGRFQCIDVPIGNTIWAEEPGSQYPSPVLADGLVYMPIRDKACTRLKELVDDIHEAGKYLICLHLTWYRAGLGRSNDDLIGRSHQLIEK